jgi:hypothetical protein
MIKLASNKRSGYEWKGVNPIHTLGGIQEVLCLSEPGLYFFLNRSDKLNALPFQKWIAGEVLPSIRKTGSYQLSDTSHDLPVIESSLVLDFQGVPIRFLIALAATKSSGYDDDQVLNTPQEAVPRADYAVFLCLHSFAPMGDGLVRKDGRTSSCVCSTSPANALNSVESLKKERSYV